MILAQFKQGNPIPVYPAPEYLAVRARITGRAGHTLRTRIYDILGREIVTEYDVLSIGDPHEFEGLDGGTYSYVITTYGEGMYLYVINVHDAITDEVLDQLSLQFVASNNVADIPDLPDKCQVNVCDKDTGLSCLYQAPATTSRIAFGPRFVSSLYKFDPEVKKAFMRCFYGGPPLPDITDLGWFTRAIVTLDYSFTDADRMLAWVTNKAIKHTTIPDDVYDLVSRADVTAEDKIQALIPYAQLGIQHDLQGRIIAMRYTVAQPTLSVDTYYRAGFLNIKWDDLLMYMAFGAAIGGAVAIGAGTLGLGLPVAATMAVGALTAMGIYFATTESPEVPPTETEKQKVVEKAEEGKGEVDKATDDAKTTVDDLVDTGKVTPDAGERIKEDIERIRITAKTVIDELVDESKRAIDSAYERGKREGMGYALLAGMGGFAGGFILGAIT